MRTIIFIKNKEELYCGAVLGCIVLGLAILLPSIMVFSERIATMSNPILVFVWCAPSGGLLISPLLLSSFVLYSLSFVRFLATRIFGSRFHAPRGNVFLETSTGKEK